MIALVVCVGVIGPAWLVANPAPALGAPIAGAPADAIYLTDLSPTGVNGCSASEWSAGYPKSIDGQTFTTGFYVHIYAYSSTPRTRCGEYILNRQYSRLRATIGLIDDSSANSTERFQFVADGTTILDTTRAYGTSQTIDLSLVGVLSLKLVVTCSGGCQPSRAAVGNPVLHKAGSRFHPIVPFRVLDSRTPTGGWNGALGTYSRGLRVAGIGSVPTNATAVVMNVTVTQPTKPSFLKTWPRGSTEPNVSSLNYGPGQTIPNLVTVKVGEYGDVYFRNADGSAHVIADIVGYYDMAASGSLFTGVTPKRILDSRGGTGGWGGPLQAGANRSLLVRGGSTSVPANATAVAMNVTVTESNAGSFVSVWPSGFTQPTSSNLNFAPGQTVPNLVISQIGSGGTVQFATAAGAVHVIADVVGYYGSSGSTFHPIDPVRILDDRANLGLAGPWLAGQTRSLNVTGTGTPAVGGTAAMLNVTATGGTDGSFLTVFPTGQSLPGSSSLNFGPGQTVPNLVAAKSGAGGAINIYNKNGQVHVIADLVGYFATT